MALYEELCRVDVVDEIKGMLQVPPTVMDGEGKVQLHRRILPDTPWINVRTKSDRSCGKWNQIYFKRYGIISEGCRKCWKVVWTGTTLDQLFYMKHCQEEMGLVSKCGIERRPWSGKLGYYQGFWYCPLEGGLDGGRERWKMLLERFQKDKVLGGTDLILKRGCTEFEHRYSPSDEWDQVAEELDWDRRQLLLDAVFIDPEFGVEPGPLRISVQKTWIEWAWEHKDPCVTREYPNKYLERPLTPMALQYQRSVHSGKDYPGWEGSGETLDERESTRERSGDSELVTEF